MQTTDKRGEPSWRVIKGERERLFASSPSEVGINLKLKLSSATNSAGSGGKPRSSQHGLAAGGHAPLRRTAPQELGRCARRSNKTTLTATCKRSACSLRRRKGWSSRRGPVLKRACNCWLCFPSLCHLAEDSCLPPPAPNAGATGGTSLTRVSRDCLGF